MTLKHFSVPDSCASRCITKECDTQREAWQPCFDRRSEANLSAQDAVHHHNDKTLQRVKHSKQDLEEGRAAVGDSQYGRHPRQSQQRQNHARAPQWRPAGWEVKRLLVRTYPFGQRWKQAKRAMHTGFKSSHFNSIVQLGLCDFIINTFVFQLLNCFHFVQ